MRLQLPKLLDNNKEAKAIRVVSFLKDWDYAEGMFQYQGLLYVPELICSKMISCHYDNLLVRHFEIDKTQELVGRKYYWPSLRKDVKSYVKRYDVYLASKTVKYKLYGDLQSLPISTYRCKNLSIDFLTRLPVSTN